MPPIHTRAIVQAIGTGAAIATRDGKHENAQSPNREKSGGGAGRLGSGDAGELP